MLCDIICSRTFDVLLYVTWLCDYDYNIYNHSIIDIVFLSYFVTCVTIICDIISHSLPESKIKKMKRKTKKKIKIRIKFIVCNFWYNYIIVCHMLKSKLQPLTSSMINYSHSKLYKSFVFYNKVYSTWKPKP